MENEDDDKVVMITPPSTLRDKVRVRANSTMDFGAASDAIAKLGVEFVTRLPGELAVIRREFDAVRVAPADEIARERLFRRVHDLKGQAGTFDFKLITIVGNDLCRFLEQPVEMTARRLKVVEFHIEAMQRVAAQNITGTGGDQGMKMINTLQGLTYKVLNE